MLRRAQGVSGLRASIAVLALPALTVLAFVGFYAAMVAAIVSAAGTAPGAWAGTDPSLPTVARAVQDRAAAAGGWDEQDHGAMLILEGHLEPWDFLATSGSTTLADAPLGSGTLDDFADAGPDERAATVAAAALPPGVAAHRVGDFVFTYHGIDSADPPVGLWLVVLCPEPSVNPGSAWPIEVAVASGGGGIAYQTMSPADLTRQNAMRAALGLPTLPDPATVTAAAPALSDDAAPPP